MTNSKHEHIGEAAIELAVLRSRLRALEDELADMKTRLVAPKPYRARSYKKATVLVLLGVLLTSGVLHGEQAADDGAKAINALFIDAKTGNVGIGTTDPNSALDVNGSLNVRQKSTLSSTKINGTLETSSSTKINGMLETTGDVSVQGSVNVAGEIRGRPRLLGEYELGLTKNGQKQMTQSATSVCFLTAVWGKFAGGAERVEIVDANGYWQLQGTSGQRDGVAAKARCIGK